MIGKTFLDNVCNLDKTSRQTTGVLFQTSEYCTLHFASFRNHHFAQRKSVTERRLHSIQPSRVLIEMEFRRSFRFETGRDKQIRRRLLQIVAVAAVVVVDR